jgi:hypothetical protein
MFFSYVKNLSGRSEVLKVALAKEDLQDNMKLTYLNHERAMSARAVLDINGLRPQRS